MILIVKNHDSDCSTVLLFWHVANQTRGIFKDFPELPWTQHPDPDPEDPAWVLHEVSSWLKLSKLLTWRKVQVWTAVCSCCGAGTTHRLLPWRSWGAWRAYHASTWPSCSCRPRRREVECLFDVLSHDHPFHCVSFWSVNYCYCSFPQWSEICLTFFSELSPNNRLWWCCRRNMVCDTSECCSGSKSVWISIRHFLIWWKI